MIGVFGATGSTGSGVVRAMVAAGRPVRAFVRDAVAARARLGADVEIVAVDLHDAPALRAALAGVTHVYGGLGRAADLLALERGVIDACAAVGVRQYVKCSGIVTGVDKPSKIQQLHGALEDHARATVPTTILAPSFFMQNFLGMAGAIQQGALPLPTGATRAGLIDAEDIVASAVAVLGDLGHLGKRYQLTGPQALSHGDAAAAFTQVLGKPVHFIDVPEAGFIAGCAQAGMPAWFAEVLADVYVRFFGSGAADLVTDDVRALTGRGPRALVDWIRDNAAAFA